MKIVSLSPSSIPNQFIPWLTRSQGRGNATIDEKPENLHLNIAWPRAHAGSVPPQTMPQVYPEHGIAPIAPNAAATTGMSYPAVPAYPGPVPQAVAAAFPQAPGLCMS
jgi:hypothetical protein